MRTIVHLSDLHFGRILEPTLAPLLRRVRSVNPHLVVISGDLTQRARTAQYARARAYLDQLPQPQLVLPGNHDVPAYNLFRRLLQPLDRYQRMITSNLSPVFIDQEIAVLGINTARSFVIKGGDISRDQLDWVEAQFHAAGKVPIRIIVGHHPFDLPPGLSGVDLVDGAGRAMRVFARCRVDMFMAGHLHLAYFGSTARYRISRYTVPVMQAGTATSTRARGEPNSYFVHQVTPDRMTTETHSWMADRGDFGLSGVHYLERVESGWSPVAQ